MIKLSDFTSNMPFQITIENEKEPWQLIKDLKKIIESLIQNLNNEYKIENGIAIHK